MGSSTWDDTPAPAADSSWKTDGDAGAGGWAPDASAGGDDGFEISDANTSKHDGGFDDGGDRPGLTGECFNCGQVGHNKADCTNERIEREFTGECRTCGERGHRAADCELAGPKICKLCKEEGHIAADCQMNRMHAFFKSLNVAELSAEDAWAAIEKADKEKDVDAMKTAVWSYAQAFPELTFEELEKAFRDSNMNTHLIAKVQEVTGVYTFVNLQGKADQEFAVSFQFSAKPRRAKFAEGWPTSPEENYTRLSQAGLPMDSLKMKCTNCSQIGHSSKQCTEEKNEGAKIEVTCANCSETGHRARDCTQPRKTGKKGCRNCGSEEHIAKECPEPPNMDNVECKNCSEMGHFSKDCPLREPEICRNCYQEGHRAKDCTNERVMKCRNCDEIGHMSRECPKPTDWSRVECSNCKEKGHSYKRCPQPVVEKEVEADAGGSGGDGGWGEGGASGGGDSGGAGGWETSNGGGGGFEASSGGW